jgi:hypothetical protein
MTGHDGGKMVADAFLQAQPCCHAEASREVDPCRAYLGAVEIAIAQDSRRSLARRRSDFMCHVPPLTILDPAIREAGIGSQPGGACHLRCMQTGIAF